MKIISRNNQKEYYDYLSGIYGEDPLIVLDRKQARSVLDEYGLGEKIKLFIGGYKTEGYRKEGKIYWGESLKALDDYEKLEPTYWKAKAKAKNEHEYRHRYCHSKESVDSMYNGGWPFGRDPLKREDYTFIDLERKEERDCMFLHSLLPDEKKYNDLHNCPILIDISYGREEKLCEHPFLTELELSQILPPEQIHRLISDWISNQRTQSENRPDTRTNIEKIEGKGFDKVTSFRTNMK